LPGARRAGGDERLEHLLDPRLDIIAVVIDPSFASKSEKDQSIAISELRIFARGVGLIGTVVPFGLVQAELCGSGRQAMAPLL